VSKLELKIGIYKITSPSGKIYIGSSKNILRRFYLYRLLRCHQQIKLYHSFIKYGVNEHVFEIICECDACELYKLEGYYGNLFNVLDNAVGLNLRLPSLGEEYQHISDESRKRISEGVLKSYDARGRASDHPNYEANRLESKRNRQNAKYSSTRKKTPEESFLNRSSTSLAGWLNPERAVKKLTTEEKKQKKLDYQKEWRLKNKDKSKLYNKSSYDRRSQKPGFAEYKKAHDKKYRKKTKESGREKRAAANKKWYEKKKMINAAVI
jgi:group I intron endonuclease